MKRYLLFFIPLLFSSFTLHESKVDQKKFRIEVKEESMLWLNTYLVTKDSLTINRFNRVTNARTYTLIKLKKDQNAGFERVMTEINWSAMQETYVDATAPQDMYTYTFAFTLDDMKKQVKIYQVKQDEIFNLVGDINQVICRFSAEYQVGYTEEYFKNKR